MNLLFDCRCLHQSMGGIGHAAVGLLRALPRKSRHIAISAIVGANVTIPNIDANVIQVDAAMIDRDFEQFHLPQVLTSLNIDAYVNFTFSIPIIKTTRIQASFIHDVVFEDHPNWVAPKLCNYLQHASRMAARFADHLFTVSEYSKRRIKAVYKVPDSRISVVHNALHAESFEYPSEQDITTVLNKFSIASPYVLFLGTCEQKKGVPQLLEAFKELAEKSDALLVIAGANGDADDLVQQFLQCNAAGRRLRRLGYVNTHEKQCLIAACDVFTYPSQYEGFGLPPLEAMALGRPTVVHNSTSLPEVVGTDARLVDVGDSHAFARVLHESLTNITIRTAAKMDGPKRARKFSWDRSAEQLIDALEAIRN